MQNIDYIKKEIENLISEKKIPDKELKAIEIRLKHLNSDIPQIREAILKFFTTYLNSFKEGKNTELLNVEECIKSIELYIKKNKNLDTKLISMLESYIEALKDDNNSYETKNEIILNFEENIRQIKNEKLINDVITVVKQDGSNYARSVYKYIDILKNSDDSDKKRHAAIYLEDILSKERIIAEGSKIKK